MIEARLSAAGISRIAGVDEAGRGAAAGPLVIAAVILNDPGEARLSEVRDSKALSPERREILYDLIIANASAYSIIRIDAGEIDDLGLQRCNIEGMRRAVEALHPAAEYVLSDGYPIPGLVAPNLAIWKGDQVALTVSAASILAKVARDRIMRELDVRFPGYGLAEHKGYGTAAHQKAIAALGVTEIHRRSFANVAAFLNKGARST